MKLGKTEKEIIRRIAGWKQQQPLKDNKARSNAIQSLKSKGLIVKEPNGPFLRFTDQAFLMMPKLKELCS